MLKKTNQGLKKGGKVKSTVLTLAHNALQGLDMTASVIPAPLLLAISCRASLVSLLFLRRRNSFLPQGPHMLFALIWPLFCPFIFSLGCRLPDSWANPFLVTCQKLPAPVSIRLLHHLRLPSSYHLTEVICYIYLCKVCFYLPSVDCELSLPCLACCLPLCRCPANMPGTFNEGAIPATSGVWKIRVPPHTPPDLWVMPENCC